MNRRAFYRELGRRLREEETVSVWTGIEGGYKGEHFFIKPGVDESDRDGRQFFREDFSGRPQVVVLGGGHISLALERVLKTLDVSLTVVDERPEFACRERFAEADRVLCMSFQEFDKVDFGSNPYYIIVTRGHRDDYICLRYALNSPRAYVGMIGSKNKVAATFERLRAEGISEELIREVHAPIGLDIGGNTPGEIAVSIAAELIQVRNQRPRIIFSEKLTEALERESGPLVMATVLVKRGSSPGKPGSRMLINRNGETFGTIGGGTVEYTVIQKAKRFLEEHPGEDLFEICEYNLSNEGAASLGMICGGYIKVLLERL